MGLGPITWKSYNPLILIIGAIFLATFLISFRDFKIGAFSIENSIAYFMAGFFLVFAGFKMVDIKGFARGYSDYDILAKRYILYGYLYPFIELAFGIFMIINFHNQTLLWLEFFVMSFSGIGVARKIVKKEQFKCVCLGTFLKVPLTTVTLVEDFGMAALAITLLILL